MNPSLELTAPTPAAAGAHTTAARAASADLGGGIAFAPSVLRHGTAAQLREALVDTRAQLLRVFDAFEAVLPAGLRVPQAPELNPPLWELGHIAWFEEFWLSRNSQRGLGAAADPSAARSAPCLAAADGLYDSSGVPHHTRWALPLPDAAQTRDYAQAVRERSLLALAEAGPGDDALYFFRLVLAHECMHLEAWCYMAQSLGLLLPPTAVGWPQPWVAALDTHEDLAVAGGTYRSGSGPGGFAFDNELAAVHTTLEPFRIAPAATRWAQYLPFVESGAYRDRRWWTADGWAWLQSAGADAAPATQPRGLRPGSKGWQQLRWGQWQPLVEQEAAVHLSQHEALAWCAWAGRRLPSEAEWEAAATAIAPGAQGRFVWAQVWEWTSSPFMPYPGFKPHPYRDYSQPFFDGRPALRGASFASSPLMHDVRYRNYFPAARTDIFAGFRSCAA